MWSAGYVQFWPPTWSDTPHLWSETKRAPLTVFERGALSFLNPRLQAIMGASSSSWVTAEAPAIPSLEGNEVFSNLFSFDVRCCALTRQIL
jgi:hypothetical protein